MASQNLNPAATSIAAAYKGATPSRGAAWDPVGKRLQQELMTFTMPAYEDLRYKLSLELPRGYPSNVPMVKFLTPGYHPNMDTQGNICLDILKDKWSALYGVRTILLSIHSLQGEPSIDSPLNRHTAELRKTLTAFKKYLQETYLKQVTSQEP
ncbi:PREDICTED: ubiquitin-conjugating enzyme E2 C-like isoform X2 [Mandrillus leucophaeus]|uniref:ubiquitin-conjugating enzyme E2 C-like isoform X2 n=1 Tax=Mandrillus leucophaeus TaxID=9568 RepID=UPI0005F3E85F|nr:PREDICTED: ubiquitin-conjugating enzyme E2 C-like isoform X2 [Mandrillus leucophaeus]